MNLFSADNWDWIPFQRIGPFVFGAPILEYVPECSLVRNPALDVSVCGENSVVYQSSITEAFYVVVEDGAIVSVNQEMYCLYKDVNLLGLPKSGLKAVLCQEPDGIEDAFEAVDASYDIWYYDVSYGLEAWFLNGTVHNVNIGGNMSNPF